ncbi:MAG: outer membrane protein assembly factor BamB [Cardiobacteriaceae bacterium]|nr:outer membrane protein assembly factor BamB [Cardiobacteriaceae bacterium]
MKKIVPRFFLSCVSLLLLASCSSTSDFFLGKDNRPPPKALPTSSGQVATAVLWKQNLGDGGEEQGLSLKPAYEGGRIYAVSANGNLSALNAENGSQVWREKLGNNISAGVAVERNIVFVGTESGDLMAVDADNAETLWRASLSGLMLAAPVAADGMVFARSIDGTLTAFDEQNGSELWRYHINEPVLSVRGNAAPVVGGGVVILTTDNGYFVVLDEKSGLPIIEQRVANSGGSNPVARLVDMDSTPQVNNGVLYGAAYQSMIFAVDLQAGQPRWQQEQVSTQKDIALSHDGVFLVNDMDHVVALNQTDGNIRWHNEQLEGRRLSPPFALSDGRVGVLDYEGWLHWLDGRNGEIIGQQKIASTSAETSAVVLRDTIVWQLKDGTLLSFRPQ